MNKKIIVISAVYLLTLVASTTLFSRTASAVTATDWQAGRIIDDAVFADPNTMSVAQIQDFLNQKVGTGGYDGVPGQCDTNGTRSAQPFSNSTRAQYAASLSRPTTFTCLSNYYEVPKTTPGPGIPASNYGGAPIPAGARSAAQLIWDAAQRYNISPKVLLVTIQKESAGPLTTDDWPFQKQYTYAMGAYCPDSGPGGAANCNENYAGFSIQISESAALKRYYLDNMDQPWWRYKKLGNNDILFQNSKPECGSSTVNITTRATAALYTYTPYQPDQAALNNLYGTGGACSAYGNRNFWRIFNDWFGSTLTDLFSSNVNWGFEELDGSAASISTNPGKLGFGVATIQDGPVLRTFYHDYNTGDLKHAWADSAGWHFETLDGDSTVGGRVTNNVGKFVKTTIAQNRLYVAYYDETTGDLRLAVRDLSSGVWTYETLDGSTTLAGRINSNVGQDIALTAYGNGLQLFYSDVAGGNLRHAWLNGSVWSFENLDGAPNSVSGTESFSGQNVSVAVHGDTLQLFYYDGSKGNLKHAWADGRGWHFEHLDGDSNAISRSEGNVGAYIDIAPFDGTLQVFYYDVARGNLKHAWADGRGWHFEHLDGDSNAISRSEGNVGARPKTFGFNGKLYVFYSNPEKGILRQAWATSAGWSFAEIDGSYVSVSRNGTTPVSTFAAVTPYGDSLQAFYFDSSKGILRHAWGVPQ